ncbi:MAG: aldo/keto reductase [Deltaproteobacteria bacterium]|nr:aldo/keto reductase [Candidatus Zymogenaceae bacterium]
MKKSRLGKTGLMVTELGFGGIPIMQLGANDAAEMVRYCFDRGVTFFDTANMYMDSEGKIGQALEGVRDQVVIATKTLERSRQKAAEHIANSLRQLRTDYIDIFQFHNLSAESELEAVLAPGGAMEAATQAKDKGQIRHIGFSAHNKDAALKVVQTGLFETIQFPFNFVETQALEALFPAAAERDMGIIAMKPLGGGMLERADICFKFLQQYPHVVPIPGVSNKEEFDQIVALYETPAPLTDRDRQEMERIREQLGDAFCRRCGYCLPCPQGVLIREAQMFPAIMKRMTPQQTLAFTKGPIATVAECIECGECEEKCPYNLPIVEMLRRHAEAYRELEALLR